MSDLVDVPMAGMQDYGGMVSRGGGRNANAPGQASAAQMQHNSEAGMGAGEYDPF